MRFYHFSLSSDGAPDFILSSIHISDYNLKGEGLTPNSSDSPKMPLMGILDRNWNDNKLFVSVDVSGRADYM